MKTVESYGLLGGLGLRRLKGVFARRLLMAAVVTALLVFLPVTGATRESPQPVGDAKQPVSEPERLSQEALDAELFSAAKRGDAIEVQKLLAKGASVLAEGDHSSGDALDWAAGLGHVEVVKVLLASLSRGEDITSGFGGIDPLAVAVVMGQDETARVLLKARPNELEKKGVERIT